MPHFAPRVSNWAILRPVRRHRGPLQRVGCYWLLCSGRRRIFASLCFALAILKRRSEHDRLRDEPDPKAVTAAIHYVIDLLADSGVFSDLLRAYAKRAGTAPGGS